MHIYLYITGATDLHSRFDLHAIGVLGPANFPAFRLTERMADAFVSLVVSATLLAGGLTTAVAATAPSSIAFHAQPLQPPTARSPITTVFEVSEYCVVVFRDPNSCCGWGRHGALQFTRSFDTCDREHDMPIGPGTTKGTDAFPFDSILP